MLVARCKNLCKKYKDKRCEGATFGGLYIFACWDFEHYEDANQTRMYHELLKDVI